MDSPQGPRVRVNGREVLCFCSNNYLGLANHPRVVAAVQQAAADWGWGSGASRLVSGSMTPHHRLEARLAAFKRAEAAVLTPSGFQANLAAICTAVGPDDVVLLDKLNHASIIDAARASGARVRVFRHCDYDDLRKTLGQTTEHGRRLIVTDSLFSMDGDLADLKALVAIKQRYDAILCIDEAHATGVFGSGGRGVAEAAGVEEHIDITVGTLSKALGGMGGFVCGSRDFVDCVINTARSFMYTTALPAAACAAAEAALDLIEAEPERRRRLLAMTADLRAQWRQNGFDVAGSASQIVPLVIGDAQRAVDLAEALLDRGILAPAIRPPTVPRGAARLRISVCADHTPEDVALLVDAVKASFPAA